MVSQNLRFFGFVHLLGFYTILDFRPGRTFPWLFMQHHDISIRICFFCTILLVKTVSAWQSENERGMKRVEAYR